MKITILSFLTFFSYSYLLVIVFSCNEEHKDVNVQEIVEKPADLKVAVPELIKTSVEDAVANNGHLGNFYLENASEVKDLYDEASYRPLWTGDGIWNPKADSLYQLINNAAYYGLFAEDYFKPELDTLRYKTLIDTAGKKEKLDASLWAKSDMLLTSAFISLVKDLRFSRIIHDTIIQKDTSYRVDLFKEQLDRFLGSSIDSFTFSLEPRRKGYHELKSALAKFLTDADLRKYSYVNPKDSNNLKQLLYTRLDEEDSIDFVSTTPDSSELAAAIKKYQKLNKLKADGKISSALVNKLNRTDYARFQQIAVTLDRYKILNELPDQYIWVNIPAYRLDLVDLDTVRLTSRIVVGKPITKTPVITSAITDMITYPQWTIPESIIEKEILPALKKDPGYLARKGYSLSDWKGNEIDPFSVDWSKYKKYIPFKVVQGSGDDNALGILKFNFPNKYSVYLHDTNQRYLFSREKRALSHGCVRVQDWKDLAYYLLYNDSTSVTATPVDSLEQWLAVKEKHVIPLRKGVPLFIRYFTCEVKEDKIIYHEDIYAEDKRLIDQYFTTK